MPVPEHALKTIIKHKEKHPINFILPEIKYSTNCPIQARQSKTHLPKCICSSLPVLRGATMIWNLPLSQTRHFYSIIKWCQTIHLKDLSI